ncbi:G-PROTEIN-RECEP-F1-2 domain-containing protein [Aphelenchoides fujianensis]|nr:G-PROTEIN-RECEP-F1-2 domain-containing protein [Aphelenchoides fujianensis]
MNENDTAALPDDFKTPDTAWCFDLLLFYRSNSEDPHSKLVLEQLETYSRFSFAVNGVITCLLASFGLLGNLFFLRQIAKSRFFSRRLALHLVALCTWDILLLLSCLLSYGIVSFTNAQFNVKIICVGIALGSFLLNMAPVPFERKLVQCYEFTPDGFQENTMLAQEEIANQPLYAIYRLPYRFCYPDLLFRAPVPYLPHRLSFTVRTLQIVSKRQVGGQQIIARRSVHYMLTALNSKFVLCCTLYVFNTILIEIMGYGSRTGSQEEGETHMENYISSSSLQISRSKLTFLISRLTPVCSMLLVVHSATNWLIFFHWPRFGSQKKYSTISTSTSKSTAIDRTAADHVLTRFSAQKYKISMDILLALCKDSPSISAQLFHELPTVDPAELQAASRAAQLERQRQEQAILHKHATELASVIEEVLHALTSKSFSIVEWRELCRGIGYKHQTVGQFCGAEQWKLIRDISGLIDEAQSTTSKWYGSKVHQVGTQNLQKTMAKVFNFALREAKSGALCAMVDNSQQIRVFKNPEINSAGRISSSMASSTMAVATSAFASKRTPGRKELNSWPQRASLKAVDSFGNSSLDSATLESPTRSRTRTLLSRFSFLTTSSADMHSDRTAGY